MDDFILKFPEFDFSDYVNTILLAGFELPAKTITQGADLKRLHELDLSDADFERLKLLIPTYLKFANAGERADLRAALASALRKKRNVLMYNSGPLTTGDVYIDTYQSPFPATIHNEETDAGLEELQTEVLCDPFARGPKRLLTSDSSPLSIILANGELSGEAWTKVSGDGTVTLSDMKDIAGAAPHSDGECIRFSHTYPWNTTEAKRSDVFSLNCANMATGRLSLWLWGYPHPAIFFEIKIGNDQNNYFYKDFTLGDLDYSSWWRNFTASVSSMLTVGAPNWANPITYVAINLTYQGAPPGGSAGDIAFDDLVLYGGGSKAPYAINLNVDKGDAPSPFKAYMYMDGNVDRIWIGRKVDNAASAPLVVTDPSAASGWTTGTIVTGQADCLKGSYYHQNVNNTPQLVFPAKYALDLCTGVYKVFARFKSLDAGSISIRRAAQDKNGEVVYGDSKTVASNVSHYQILELGDLSVPLRKPTSEAVLANMFTTIGLEVTGSSATNYDFHTNWIILLPIDGGAVFLQLPSGLQNLIFDTITRGGSTLYGNGSDDQAYSLRKYVRGDLEILNPGNNTLVFLAYDSTNVDAVRNLQLLNLYAELRYDLIRKL